MCAGWGRGVLSMRTCMQRSKEDLRYPAVCSLPCSFKTGSLSPYRIGLQVLRFEHLSSCLPSKYSSR